MYLNVSFGVKFLRIFTCHFACLVSNDFNLSSNRPCHRRMTGPNTRSRAQHDEGSPSRGPRSALVGEPSQQHHQRGSTPEEVLPPPPSMAEVLIQIERNRMD